MVYLLIFLQKLLALALSASATLPLLFVMGLVIGRRGNARYCLEFAVPFASFAASLAALSALYFLCTYLAIVLPYNTDRAIFSALFTKAGLPWLLASSCWLAGLILFLWARLALGRLAGCLELEGDKYKLGQLKTPLICFLLAAAAFMLAFFCENWPFGGLPSGVSLERAGQAVLRYTMHRYFMAFSLAGASGLIFAYIFFQRRGATRTEFQSPTLRFFAFFAVAGLLPGLLQKWGFALGALLGNNITLGQKALGAQFIPLALQSCAFLLWVWVLLRPMKMRWRPGLALLLFTVAVLLPTNLFMGQ